MAEGLTLEKLRAARDRLMDVEPLGPIFIMVNPRPAPRSKKRRIRKKWRKGVRWVTIEESRGIDKEIVRAFRGR